MESRILEASLTGDVTTLHALLSEDPVLLDRVTLNSVETPLHISSMAGQTEITREFLALRPNWARQLNQQGLSPLHMASANGHAEIVKEIIVSVVGADLCRLKGRDGKVSLHCAAMKGQVGALRELVSACPESLSEVTVGDETALHLAVKSNQFEAVRVLVEELRKLGRMEIVNWRDREGNTVLHLAAFHRQHEMIDLLIGDVEAAKIINTNPVNTSGFTPRDVLDLILQNGSSSGLNDIKMIETFQKAGALKSKDLQKNPNKKPHTNNITNSNTPKCSFVVTLWRELAKEVEESSIETQSALMVVAVLIATMTYQAILSPPSGFSSSVDRFENRYSKHDVVSTKKAISVGEGEAVMASDPHVFVIFTVFNAIGFFASLGMISVLTSGFPLRAGLRLAILSMVATYVIAVFYEAPTKMRTVFVVLWLMGLVVLFELGRFAFWLLRKCRTGSRRSRASADRHVQQNDHELDF